MGNWVKKYFCFINKIQYPTNNKVRFNINSYDHEPGVVKSHSIHRNGITESVSGTDRKHYWLFSGYFTKPNERFFRN